MKSPDSSQVTSVQALSLVKSDERFHSQAFSLKGEKIRHLTRVSPHDTKLYTDVLCIANPCSEVEI